MKLVTKTDRQGHLRSRTLGVRIAIALGLAAFAVAPRQALATSSLAGIMAHSPDDISGHSTLTGDDNTVSVTLPFTFTIEGTNYTTIVLSTNGWIEFGSNTSGSSEPGNACLPASTHTNPFLAAYWDDLVPFGTNIRYRTVGTAPNRVFLADYEVDLFSGSEGSDDLRFQVQLHERSNIITVRYRDQQSQTNGISATIGFQGAGGAAAATVQPLTCNGKILDDNRPNEGWSVDVGRAGLVTMAAVTMHSPDDISGFSTLTGDEATANVTLPFSVTLEGTSYSTLTLSTNGWIEFGGNTAGSADFTNGCLPVSNHTNPFLAAYWDDLQPFGTNIRYGTVGTAPNRTFIVDYEVDQFSGPEGSDDTRMQVQIHERSSLISVRYRDSQNNANGQSATIGFQGAGGSAASAYPITCNGKVLDDNLNDRDGWSVHPKALRAMSLHSILAHSPDDIGGFTTISGDSTVTNVSLPFSFNIDGTNYSTIAVSTNGWIEFGGNTSGSSDPVNGCLPVSNHTNPFLAPYWDDMTTASTNIRHGVVGTSPNRTYVLDFYLLTTTGGDDSGNDDVAFQVLLHETSNTISVKYHLEQHQVNGQNATIGFQSAGGASATAYPLTCNGKILDDNRNGEGWSIAPLPICGNSLIETKEQCDQGAANGSATSCCTSACTFRTAGQTCRVSAGTCDVAETCTGSSATCPADVFQPSTTVCRAAAGECDLAENCLGNAAACPADAKKASGTLCTDDGNECTNDQCDGTNVLCQHPAKTNGTACTDDGNVCTTDTCQSGVCSHPAGNAGTLCRGSAGVCDVAETCNGVSPTCPADGFQSTSTTCRPSAGVCDVAENCTGSGAACPVDGFQSTSTTCRPSAGVCDVAENCTGSGAACPADGFQSTSTTCRASAGICDVAENCTGASATCPADAFEPSSTPCRGSAGACDVAENCTGSSATCPADAFEPSTVVCRPDAGECDLAENCTGSGAACPADAKKANGTACTDDGNPCSLDQCDGTNVTCQHPAGNAGAICRTAAGVCDVAETCTGSSTVCPADAFEPTTTECRASAGECDPAESCPGTGPNCPADARDPSGTACSTDGNPCTVDQCDGTNVACQHPAGNAGTVCRTGSGDACDPDEVCTGASPTCPADVTLPGFTCRPAAGECDVAENCGGLPTDPCPPDAKKPSGSLCTSDGNPCSLDECNGTSDLCQHPAGNAGATCRPAAGICDVDEVCTGSSTTCPADAFEPSSVVCRPDAGECDLAENCTGSGAACPADAKKPSGTACTDDGNPCSVDECNGTSDTCQHPAGNAGATCRSAAGVCDVAETCTGSSTVCPTDAFEPTTTECRASNGECDPAENCPGTGPTCPADVKASAGTSCTDDGNPCSLDQCNGTSDLCQHPAGNAGAICRPSAGDCDVVETCTGASTVCPSDAFEPSTLVCRPSGGECDPAENCPGTGPSCPLDAKDPSGTACTSDGNPCSLDECDGVSDTCQHPAGNAGTTCRPSAGACDVVETCTGSSTVCPTDAFEPSSVVCRPASGVCDLGESCTGSGPACPPDLLESAGTVCRPSAGVCDVQETCDGASTTCPPDAFQASSTVCRAAADVCDVAESCTGSSAPCPTDAFAPSSQVCRAAAGVCDVTESCTGTGAACPADAVEPSTTECRASTDVCDPAENCDGTNKTCPIDLELPDGTSCSDGSTCTASDICVAGMCVGDLMPDDCLDDFTCYQVRINPSGGSFGSVSGVTLVDEFESASATISRPKVLCPPTNKNAEGVVDDDTHLVAYAMRQSPGHTRRTGLKVTNQLGSVFLDTMRPDTLLVPTAKDLLASPPAPDLGAIAVDHYKCYRVKPTRGKPAFPSNTTVEVTDQFDTAPRLLALRKPRRLCNPVDKNGEGIKNPNVHLLCYQAGPARGERRHVPRLGLYINNQFGPLRLNTMREREFCIPSVLTP
jgi:hypothetical protein